MTDREQGVSVCSTPTRSKIEHRVDLVLFAALFEHGTRNESEPGNLHLQNWLAPVASAFRLSQTPIRLAESEFPSRAEVAYRREKNSREWDYVPAVISIAVKHDDGDGAGVNETSVVCA